MFLVKFKVLLVIIMLVMAILLPLIDAFEQGFELSAENYHDVEIEEKDYEFFLETRGSDNSNNKGVDKKLEEVLKYLSVFYSSSDYVRSGFVPLLLDIDSQNRYGLNLVRYNETNTRHGGSIYVFNNPIALTTNVWVSIEFPNNIKQVKSLNITFITTFITAYVMNNSTNEWRVVKDVSTNDGVAVLQYENSSFKIENPKGTEKVNIEKTLITNMLYLLTIYSIPKSLSNDNLFVYFNVKDVTISLVYNKNAGASWSKDISIANLASMKKISYRESGDLSQIIKSEMISLFNRYKTNILNRVVDDYNLYQLTTQHFDELYNRFYENILNKINLFKVSSVGLVEYLNIGVSGTTVVTNYRKINKTNPNDVKTIISYKQYSYRSSDSITPEETYLGGYYEKDLVNVLKGYIRDSIRNSLKSCRVSYDYNTNGAKMNTQWCSAGIELKDNDELLFAKQDTMELGYISILPENEKYENRFKGDVSQYIIKYSDKNKWNEKASFVLINPYPLRDPNIWEKYSGDLNNFEKDRAFVDFFAEFNKGNEINSLSKLILNNNQVSNGYSMSVYLNNIYSTEDDKFRYEASISTTLVFTFTAVTRDYISTLMLRNLLNGINVSIKVNVIKLPDPADQSVKKDPPNNIGIIPSLAPIHGYGIPNKAISIASYFNKDALNYIDQLEKLFSNNTFMNVLTKTVIPSYYPIPLPESLNLNKFSPGEYIGAYILIKDKIDLSHASMINSFPGISTVTLIFEEIEVSYQESGGYISTVGRSWTYSPNKNFTLYTIGLGVGRVGDAIGPRLYIFPSSESSIPRSENTEFISNGRKIFEFLLKLIFPNKPDLLGNLLNNGVYVNFVSYINSDGTNSIWPYVLLTVNNGYRFIANKTGELAVRVKGIYVVHIKIVKLPVLGLPIPIPIPLYWYEANNNKNNSTAQIIVENIGVIPLFITYDSIRLKPISGLDTAELIKKAYIDRYVYIYAMLSWINESGYPTGPVLMRGLYYSPQSQGSLGIGVMDTTNGEIISHVRVTDIGLAMQLLRIRYSDLKRIGYGIRKMVLVPVWYESVSVVIGLSNVNPPPYSYFNISSPSLIQIHRFNEKELLVYIGSWRDVSLLDKAESKAESRDYLNTIQSVIGNIANLNISKDTDGLFNSLTELLNNENTSSLVDSIIEEMNDFKENFTKYIVETIICLSTSIAIESVKSIALVLFPDPTGGLVSSLISYIVNRVEGIINNYLSNTIEPDEMILRFFENIAKIIARHLIMTTLKQIVTSTLLDQLKSVLGSICGILNELEFEIHELYNVLEWIEQYSYYYPVFFSHIEIYDAQTFNSISWRGIISDKFLLPLDKLSITSTGEFGVIVFVKPYYVQEFLLNAIGELLNIDLLKQFRGQYIIHGILLAVTSWSYYIGSILNNINLLNQISHSVYKIYENYFMAIGKITEWVSVYGLGNEIGYPEIRYIPPITIS